VPDAREASDGKSGIYLDRAFTNYECPIRRKAFLGGSFKEVRSSRHQSKPVCRQLRNAKVSAAFRDQYARVRETVAVPWHLLIGGCGHRLGGVQAAFLSASSSSETLALSPPEPSLCSHENSMGAFPGAAS
jgi:hypothetical protein